MHLDVEQTERLLAGELLDDDASTRAHLGACSDCAARLQAAQRADTEVGELLRLIDRPPPRVSVHALMNARARKRFGWGARAASIALLLGAGAAAYALPGSPLRKWLGLERPAVVDSPVVAPAPPAGIALEPGASLTITFARAGSGEVIVSLNDSSVVVVQARGGAASFNSEDDRLLIDNHDPAASFELRIPRNAPYVEVRIGEQRVFLKRGSEVSADVVASAGSYVIPLRR